VRHILYPPLMRLAIRYLLVAVAVQLGGCAWGSHLQKEEVQRIAESPYVVTSATSGIGRGTALKLDSLGANVVVAARRTALLEEVANQIRTAGGHALAVTTASAVRKQYVIWRMLRYPVSAVSMSGSTMLVPAR
jgi:hypothetical protein